MPLIPLIIAGATALGGQGISMYNEAKGSEKAAEYEEMVRQKREREARKQALKRVIGEGFLTKGYEDPRAPDLSAYAMRAGLGRLLGNAGSLVAGKLSAKTPTDAVKILPDDISSLFAGMA